MSPAPRPGDSADRRMPRAVERFVAEWSADPTGQLPSVTHEEALIRARNVIPYIEAAVAGDYNLRAAIETSLELLLLAWAYLDVTPGADDQAVSS